jgi:hypothetical protein
MATQRQIAANRRNAQRSTGPRSAEGKVVSRFNALKHGIDAESQCLPTEDPESLAELAAEYHERFAPATPEERALVDVLVSAEWDLRRYRVASAQLWQMASDDELPMAVGFHRREATFMRLQRAIDSAQRNYRHALDTLRRLQADPDRPEPEEPKEETPKLASFPKKSPKPSPNRPKRDLFEPAPAKPICEDEPPQLRDLFEPR